MGLNLHAMVRGAITTVNPDRPAALKRSLGYETLPSGKQVPKFETLSGMVQVQGTNSSDLRHAEFLNIQGVLRSVYLFGNWYGVVRADQKGGDILSFCDFGETKPKDWKVVSVLESWENWTKVLVCQQVST